VSERMYQMRKASASFYSLLLARVRLAGA
jgi:hypothetical protein